MKPCTYPSSLSQAHTNQGKKGWWQCALAKSCWEDAVETKTLEYILSGKRREMKEVGVWQRRKRRQEKKEEEEIKKKTSGVFVKTQ